MDAAAGETPPGVRRRGISPWRPVSRGTTPRRWARITAWTRSRAPSFASTRPTWVFTVDSLTNSSAPISALVSPRASRDEDLVLALGEVVQTLIGRGIRGKPVAEHLEHPARDARRQHRVAAVRGPDRAGELVGVRVLEEEPARPGAQRRERVLVQVEGGQHDDADVRMLAPRCAGWLRGRPSAASARPSAPRRDERCRPLPRPRCRPPRRRRRRDPARPRARAGTRGGSAADRRRAARDRRSCRLSHGRLELAPSSVGSPRRPVGSSAVRRQTPGAASPATTVPPRVRPAPAGRAGPSPRPSTRLRAARRRSRRRRGRRTASTR